MRKELSCERDKRERKIDIAKTDHGVWKSIFILRPLIIFLNKTPDVVRMVVVVEFNIIPLGKGTSVSKFLAPALRELENRKVRYEITPMCTIFEAKSVGEAFDLIKAAYDTVFQAGMKRVVTTVKIDDRRDIERGMKEKVTSLKRAVRKA